MVYRGRLQAHLPSAHRLILVKADGSISIHSDDRAYKPLNWMNPPCSITEETSDDGVHRWLVRASKGDELEITIEDTCADGGPRLALVDSAPDDANEEAVGGV